MEFVTLPCIVVSKNKNPKLETGDGEIVSLYPSNYEHENVHFMLDLFNKGTGHLYDYEKAYINTKDIVYRNVRGLHPTMFHPKYMKPTPGRGESEVTLEDVLHTVQWYWSDEDETYLFISPLEPRIIGAGDGIHESATIFKEIAEATFESHKAGKCAWVPGIFDVKRWPEHPFESVKEEENNGTSEDLV